MVESGEQFDDRIVECYWTLEPNAATEPYASQGTKLPPRWRMMRIRDDKHHGNHKSIVEKILRSIRDGVDADELVSAAPAIRTAWKMPDRERQRQEAGQVTNSNPLPLPTSKDPITATDISDHSTPNAPYDSSQPFGGMACRGVKGKAPPIPCGGPPGIIRR